MRSLRRYCFIDELFEELAEAGYVVVPVEVLADLVAFEEEIDYDESVTVDLNTGARGTAAVRT